MNEQVKEIESKLSNIIEKNEDAIKGFEKAAENAKETAIQSFFSQRAQNRRTFLTQLRNSASELNLGDTDITGSTTGAMHRTWMDIKAFFSTDNDEAMLEEAVRGDKAAVEEYNKVLAESHVPISVKGILREQRDSIQNDLETSDILEDYR